MSSATRSSGTDLLARGLRALGWRITRLLQAHDAPRKPYWPGAAGEDGS